MVKLTYFNYGNRYGRVASGTFEWRGQEIQVIVADQITLTLEINHLYPIVDEWGERISVSSKTPNDWHRRPITKQELETQVNLMLPILEAKCRQEIRRVIAELLACVDKAKNLLNTINGASND